MLGNICVLIIRWPVYGVKFELVLCILDKTSSILLQVWEEREWRKRVELHNKNVIGNQ